MKLIIDIDKDYYEKIKHYYELIKDDVEVNHNDFKPYNIIAKGTPLPKGHGDLIDADALISSIEEYRLEYAYSEEDETRNRMIDYINEDIYDAPAIIEADKAENEEV